MAQRERQRGGGKRNAVRLDHRLDAGDPLEDGSRRRRVIVLSARGRPGGEDAAVERAADDDADAALEAERQKFVGRFLLEQRVAAGEQHAVDRRAEREVAAHLPFVDADADSTDDTRRLQIGEGAIGAVEGLRQRPAAGDRRASIGRRRG